MTPQIFLVPKKVDSLSHEYGDKELKNITRFLFIHELQGNDSLG